MNTKDTEWKSFEKYLEHVCFEANPSVLDDDMPDFFDDWLGNQNGEDYIRLADEYASARDAYWKERVREVLQGVYDKGLQTVEQIKQSALGWGEEGSERYEGYIKGAKDVNSLVIWELCSHGIRLDLSGEPTPITKDNLK